MRRLLTGLVVATTTALLPVFASAGNQEVANQIAKNLRDSGELSNYKIGVKFQDGTAWLSGLVTSQQQMTAALHQVFKTSNVDRVVNDLKIDPGEMVEVTPVVAKSARRMQPADGALAPEESGIATRIRMVSAEDPRPIASQPAARSIARLPVRPAAKPMAPARNLGRPIPISYTQMGAAPGNPIPAYVPGAGGGGAPMRCDQPNMPNYAWPSYASHPNYGALTYPRQYSPTAWPFIGPFYPYPQVPLGWRKVTLEWDDGWWMLDFCDR
ncbi:MAG: BON domain-containing protein [Candidatus Nealsonbacteria bacterium]|nr:BON domain-containing protein [Candidatus Nealsonbacteria bacterium]